MLVITIQSDEPVAVQGRSYCADAAEIWRTLTWDDINGMRGGKPDKAGVPTRARRVVRGELDRRHPEDGFLFNGMIPKMLAAQGIDARQIPEHLVM